MADERLDIADLLIKAGLSASEAGRVQVAMNLAAELPTSGSGGGSARREVLVEGVDVFDTQYTNVRSFNRETLGGTGTNQMNIMRIEGTSWLGMFSEFWLISEGSAYLGDKWRQLVRRNINYQPSFELAMGTTQIPIQDEMEYHLWGGDQIRAYAPATVTLAHNLGTTNVRAEIRLTFDAALESYIYIPCPCYAKNINSSTISAGATLAQTANMFSFFVQDETFDPETATVDILFYTYEE